MRIRYIPTYGMGGNFQDQGFGSFMSGQYGQAIGNASSGYFAGKGATAEEPWEQSYNAGMGVVSKAGPIGAVIGGVTAVGDAIGDPIRKKAESINSQGEFDNFQKTEKLATVGSMLNPFKSGMASLNDPDASTREKFGSFFGMGGAQRERLKRKEKQLAEAQAEENRQQFATMRLGEMSNQPQMQFKSGGYIPTFPNGGSISPAADSTLSNYRPQYVVPQNYGDFDKADYGDLLKSIPQYTPGTDSVVATKNLYKGVPGYQYALPGSTGGRMESYQVDGKTRFAGSEVPVKANGGYLEETRNNSDLTYYANGGTHESNKNGGIPIGNKGLVEEGEFRYKDYIFTNRY